MRATRAQRRVLQHTGLTAVIVVVIPLLSCGNAFASLGGVIEAEYGAKVNGTTGGNFCEPYSGDACQIGEASTIPGGLAAFSPQGVAVDPVTGYFYVADTANDRVQELTPTGEFVLMFGKHVNGKTGADICTAAEAAVCKAGAPSGEAGGIVEPITIAVDQSGERVYVGEDANGGNNRVDEFTPTGEFLLMLGLHVNKKTNGNRNLCTKTEECQAAPGTGSDEAELANEHGALMIFAEKGTGGGNIVTAGGPEGLLYVGSEHRVQEFKPDGTWVGEISLESISPGFLATVTGIAVASNGEVYLTYPLEDLQPANIVYKFAPVSGKPTEYTADGQIALTAREPGATRISAEGLALNSATGDLAVSEEEETATAKKWFGSVLDAATGAPKAVFRVPVDQFGLAREPGLSPYHPASEPSNPVGEQVYAAVPRRGETLRYGLKTGADLTINSSVSCQLAPALQESRATFECPLSGTVDPLNVPETKAWFQWGKEPVSGERTNDTSKQAVSEGNSPIPVSTTIQGLIPNTTYHIKLAAEDHNFHAPELPLTSGEASFTTQVVPAVIVGEPSVSFVKAESVDFFGELDPENASTQYEFEYARYEPGACEHLGACHNVSRTGTLESNVYRQIATTQEATGLLPASRYLYRLMATNKAGAVPSVEGSFETAPPVMPQAVTGPHGAPGVTSALISGEVNPDGEPAAYAFEIGVDNGSATQYATASSGSAGEGSAPVREELQLTNLQPATTYAYRIAITSAFVKNETHTLQGEPATFTTEGLPSVLKPPPLAIPVAMPGSIHFPCQPGYKHNKQGHCVKATQAKKRRGKKKKVRRRSHHAGKHSHKRKS